MSDATSGSSHDGDKKADETPREPTDIVVFRGEARDGASTGGTSGEGASYRWQEAPRLEIPYHGAQPATRRWNGRIAAVVAIAALIGAVGGALATSSISRLIAGDKAEAMAAAAAGELKAARTAVSKLETQVASLKADADKADKAAKARNAQLGKVNERLEKAEKAHEETSSRLAKLAETQEKERRAAAAAEATGSLPSAGKNPSQEVASREAIAGWRLNRIVRGGAEVEEAGVRYVVYPGDPLPGLGAVAGLRRIEDGRWAVVTPKGLILGR